MATSSTIKITYLRVIYRANNLTVLPSVIFPNIYIFAFYGANLAIIFDSKSTEISNDLFQTFLYYLYVKEVEDIRKWRFFRFFARIISMIYQQLADRQTFFALWIVFRIQKFRRIEEHWMDFFVKPFEQWLDVWKWFRCILFVFKLIYSKNLFMCLFWLVHKTWWSSFVNFKICNQLYN